MVRRAFALLIALWSVSCSGEKGSGSGPVNVACATDRMLGEVCAGVPQSAVCATDRCVTGVSCSRVVDVANRAELAGALAGASSGTCLALAPGDYDEAALPGGVSLLGKSASAVRVAKITLAKGDGAVVRGVTVGVGGVVVSGATNARLDSVVVDKSAGDGVLISSGSSLVIAASEVRGSAKHGVLAIDAVHVRIEASSVVGSKGPGLWAECSAACDCKNQDVALSLSGVVLNDNRVVGISLVGMRAELDAVDVTGNAVADDFAGSGGISASQCSAAVATRVRVLDNSAYGVLIDGSSATLGTSDPARGIEVSRNLVGIWVQNLRPSAAKPVVISNARVLGNSGVGIGLGGGQSGVAIHASEIGGTLSKMIPSIQNGIPKARQVGHGIVWMGHAQAELDGLSLHGNAMASLLIDGEVGVGSFAKNLVLAEGDEAKGVLQQNLPAPQQPVDSLPAPQRTSEQRFPLPAAPAVPLRR